MTHRPLNSEWNLASSSTKIGRKSWKNAMVTATGIGILILLFLYGLGWGLHIFFAQRQHHWEKQWRILQPQFNALQQLKTQNKLVATKIEALTALNRHLHSPAEVLEKLPNIMVNGIFLNCISVQQETVHLNGNAQTQTQIQQFLQSLAKQPWIHQPKLLTIMPENDLPPYRWFFELEFNKETKG